MLLVVRSGVDHESDYQGRGDARLSRLCPPRGQARLPTEANAFALYGVLCLWQRGRGARQAEEHPWLLNIRAVGLRARTATVRKEE